MTIRPASSTPQVTGDACGPPSFLVVITIARCLTLMNSVSSSRLTTLFVAIVLATPATLVHGAPMLAVTVAGGPMPAPRSAEYLPFWCLSDQQHLDSLSHERIVIPSGEGKRAALRLTNCRPVIPTVTTGSMPRDSLRWVTPHQSMRSWANGGLSTDSRLRSQQGERSWEIRASRPRRIRAPRASAICRHQYIHGCRSNAAGAAKAAFRALRRADP
jgi:hypothetical protein